MNPIETAARRVVAFDMVGVVLDEERIVSTTLFEMLPKPPRIERDELKARYDSGLRLGRITREEFWSGVVSGDWKAFEREFIEGLRLVPGVKDAMRGFFESDEVAVISDLPARWANIALDHAELSRYVSYGAYADEHGGARKKDGSLFRALEREMEVQPRECVVLDDTLENVRAAEALGMRAVWFKREGRSGDGKQVKAVHRFDELSAVLGRD